MGPTLGPPVDRYARRREQGQKLAGSIQGFFNKLEEKEAERIENEAYEKEGLILEGKRGKARELAIKGHHEGNLQKKIIGEKLRSEKAFDEYKREKDQQEDFGLVNEAIGETGEKGFNFKNPASWRTDQIDSLRAIKAKTPKAKALAQVAQQEYDRRQEHKKIREKIAPLQGALQVINNMEELGNKGNLGIGSSAYQIISPETRKDREEYEQLGKSLIQFASNISIRNQAEFNTLAEKLYDPSISDAGRKGILDAMKRIIQNSMNAYTENEPEETAEQIQKQERPPLTSFIRQ